MLGATKATFTDFAECVRAVQAERATTTKSDTPEE